MDETYADANNPTYGARFPGGHQDKFFELYQKGVEIGTWDVEALIADAPVQQDKTEWKRMTDEQQLVWSNLVARFLDGEQNVAIDATKLVQMVDSPYIDDSANKEAFYTGLQFEEVKHTQFCAWYAENVVPDQVFPTIGKGSRHGLSRLDDSSKADHFSERIEDILNTAVYTKQPHDIARAATNYGIFTEGVRARVRYSHMKEMAEETDLRTWLTAIEEISTDEGRHITGQVELIKELVEKEKDGIADYQGVSDTVLTQLQDAVKLLAKGALGSIFQMQIVKDERLADEEFDDQVDHHVKLRMRYLNDIFRETLALPGYDDDNIELQLRAAIDEIRGSVPDTEAFLATIEHNRSAAQDLREYEDGIGLASRPGNR
ncbi:hypothetical protein [Halobellus sp. GM3]|uniref:hypothetical protein n=1 Tax=Halobellus sp. GM3 TaxID=3458410 RepID=UPI00403D9431